MDSLLAEEEPWPESPPKRRRSHGRGRDDDPWPDDSTEAWEVSVSHKKGKKRGAPPAWAWDEDVSKVAHVSKVARVSQGAPKTRSVNLGFAPGSIESALTAEHSQEPTTLSHYAKIAADPIAMENKLKDGRPGNELNFRIRAASQSHPGRCTCAGYKHACHRRVPRKALLAAVTSFHGLSRQMQAQLLRILYSAAQGNPENCESSSDDDADTTERMVAVQWTLCGTPVCWSNFLWLMSLGSHTVRKMLKGIPDGRSFAKRSPIADKAQSVDFFFCELYHSSAEPLPCDGQRLQYAKTKGKGKQMNDDADVWFEDGPWLSAGEDPNREDASAMSTTSATSAARQEWNPDAPSVDVLLGFTIASSETVVGMPRRYLSHCHLHDLYWMFEASWDCLRARSPVPILAECPSFSLFRQRWQIWRRYLKIRKPAQHAQCQTCWELQRAMNAKEASWSKRAQAAKDLREHYQFQYMDRCVYWSMRWASRFMGSVLCVIIDSMDKTKMAYPRWPFDRNPKSLDKLIRPRFVFTLAIAHGWCTAAYVQDEVQNHGSSAFCEVLLRVVEHVWVTCRTSGRAFPQHLVIQSDNTVAQAKNQHCFLVLAFFVAKYKFITANLFF